MDYTSRWPEPQAPPLNHRLYSAPPHDHHLNLIQQHQPPQQPPPLSHSSYHSNPYPHNPNPILNHNYPTADAGFLRTPPPPANPYLPNPYAPHGGYSYPPVGPGAGAGVGAISGTSYYYGGGDSHGFAAKEAIRQYGVDPISYGATPARPSNGLDPTVPPHVLPPHWKTKPTSKSGAKKGSKRIMQVVRSAYCEVCKIDCNSQEVLNTHKQGKKHKKKLQKLQESITPKAQKAATTINPIEKKEAPVAGKGKAAGSEQTKRKVAPATEEDLETKKRKILEGGAAPEEVKVCTICNIVVNSQKVYDYHIAGQKHVAMVKKQEEAAAS